MRQPQEKHSNGYMNLRVEACKFTGRNLLGHHLAKFEGHMYFSNRDIFLVCHLVKQGHVIKVSIGAPQGNSLSCQVCWS